MPQYICCFNNRREIINSYGVCTSNIWSPTTQRWFCPSHLAGATTHHPGVKKSPLGGGWWRPPTSEWSVTIFLMYKHHSIIMQQRRCRRAPPPTTQGWWVPLHSVQRPISPEYQICTPTIPLDTLVTEWVMTQAGWLVGFARLLTQLFSKLSLQPPLAE